MKKKRLKLVTTIALLAALAGGSGGVAWGQIYLYPPNNSSRNVNNIFGAGESSFISSGNNTSQNVRTPWTNSLSFNWSGTGFSTNPLKNPVSTIDLSTQSILPLSDADAPDIVFGGPLAENTVIRAYTGNGFAAGWLSVMLYTKPNTYSTTTDYDVLKSSSNFDNSYTAPYNFRANANDQKIREFSFNKFNYYNFSAVSSPPGSSCQNPWHSIHDNCPPPAPQYSSGNGWAPCQYNVFSTSNYIQNLDGSVSLTVSHHNQIADPDAAARSVTASPSDRPTGLYTSTIDGTYRKNWPGGYFDGALPNQGAGVDIDYPTDDGIALVQFSGSNMTDGGALQGQITNSLSSSAANPLGDIATSVFTNLNQWGDTSKTKNLHYLSNYRRPTTIVLDPGDHRFKNFKFNDIKWKFQKDSVVATHNYEGKLGQCYTGGVYAYTFSVDWRNKQKYGATLVDGAIVLRPETRVCVEGDVKDATTDRGSEHDGTDSPNDKTDAIMVFPDITTGGRFTLRVRGSVDSLNMAQGPTGSATPVSDLFYKQKTFPQHAQHIYLYKDANASNAHAFPTPHLGTFTNNHPSFITNHPITVAPITEAQASIFGLFKDYLHDGVNNAEIHTDTVKNNYNGNIPGVIEVGRRGIGRKHLHVYSGGILKNFEGCMPLDNFTMHFGGEYGTPDLKITSDKPLYILNYGNNDNKTVCDANIIFHHDAVDTVANAINGEPSHYTGLTTGKGTLRIQALGDVEFQRNEDWKPINQNDVLVLSEGKNVITQKIKYEGGYQDGIAQGLLTFWAEDNLPPGANRNGCGNNWATDRNSTHGNVYMNHEVEIKRPATSGGSTETNVIAAHNIRTAKFTYEGLMNFQDTMNVISRRGDIYLGYSAGTNVYTSGVAGPNGLTAEQNDFIYKADQATKDGELFIKAGWDDAKPTMTKTDRSEGGNIYFTRLDATMATAASTLKHNTTISIPYSSEYICNEDLYKRKEESMLYYEHSGIIGGLGRCAAESQKGWNEYADKLENSPSLAALGSMAIAAGKRSIIYKGDAGELNMDAGTRGNIIMNQGADLDYNDNTGNAIFRTREGDIDMRNGFDVQKMKGSLLFLAQLEDLGKLSDIGVCGCDEMRNNVYLQDFKYTATGNSGSVFVGADNNIKLNYGGLTNIGTRQDPFLSTDYETYPNGAVKKIGRGYKGVDAGCGLNYHCDLNGDENKARLLLLDFSGTVTSGGFAAVASDMIDVYTDLKYKGGNGSGLSTVPGTGTLHGENVAGYGLFMKTQGNKHNWTDNILLQAPKCPTTCSPTGCGAPGRPATGFLHNTVRMTFHSDARFYAENQHVHLESPVIETFGVLELNAEDGAGANAMITIKTDSLICHDSLIRKGTGKVQLTTWSGLPKDQPIIKLGYSRKAAPFKEYAYDDGSTEKLCRECVTHYKGKVYAPGETPLDTMFVKFGPDTEWERQNVMVVDHTVISFLTDSFDHVRGGDVRHARYFVDTTKIRNQVEFWTDAKHERDGHLELISEEQMGSKDYAGLYTRHLHLEPIGACGRPTSELWLPGLALDVITTSTFGGFGIQYTDVHVENGANLNPGFTSLRLRGQCYEQACGTLTMKDLRLDGGSELHFSVGTTKGLNGEYSDAIDVDRLTTYGPVNVNIEIRPCEKIEKRCYPIMYYKSVTPNSLNNLKLNPRKVKIDGEEYPLSLNVSTDGIVYVCVGDAVTPGLTHTVTMPETAGVKTTPSKGIYPLPTRTSFRFSATYSGAKPLVVRTNRKVNGQQEVLNGVKNANGEYEYIVPSVQQEVTLTFGPDVVANELLTAGTAVWSHGEKIYIRVERADIASIYSVAGQLVKRVDLPEGDTSIPMSRGAYVITLKDGSVHKVIVK